MEITKLETLREPYVDRFMHLVCLIEPRLSSNRAARSLAALSVAERAPILFAKFIALTRLASAAACWPWARKKSIAPAERRF